MDLSSAKIAIIGLGYVGLPLAVAFGRQRPVLGCDINIARDSELQSDRDSTLEVELKDLVAASHLQFISNTADLKACASQLAVALGLGSRSASNELGHEDLAAIANLNPQNF